MLIMYRYKVKLKFICIESYMKNLVAHQRPKVLLDWGGDLHPGCLASWGVVTLPLTVGSDLGVGRFSHS